MRWKDKSPKVGDKRTFESFLLFPEKVDGVWAWLEQARFHQEYIHAGGGGSAGVWKKWHTNRIEVKPYDK